MVVVVVVVPVGGGGGGGWTARSVGAAGAVVPWRAACAGAAPSQRAVASTACSRVAEGRPTVRSHCNRVCPVWV